MASQRADTLPVRLNPFVGRERELRDVVDALGSCRLLTLTGPGGMGKTRLALAAADLAGLDFEGGVCWVELAPVADPAQVPAAVAQRLGIAQSQEADVAAMIAEQVGDQPTLVVIDNCEHQTAAVAGLACQMLGACRALTILATSREVLGVEGERNWPVPPLSLPRPKAASAASLSSFDAIKLFEQRARLVRPAFKVADDNAAAVAEVCSRLDGLPLAIELAAARMRVLSAGQLAERLDDVFTALGAGARTAPPRHQTLRATLDWSHDLLDEPERVVFRRLGVFPAGFTLAAAEQVAGWGEIAPGDLLELLSRLADKSLIRVDLAGADARYHLLATVREYARERLAQVREHDRTALAHLRYVIDLVERLEPRIDRCESCARPEEFEQVLDVLDAELPSLRSAFEYASSRGDGVAALRVVAPLGRFAYLRGHYQVVRAWLDEAVSIGADTMPQPRPQLRAKALLGSGKLALLQCDYVPAVRRLERALRLYTELDDPAGISAALQVLGSVAREQGRYARSMELNTRSLAVARAIDDRWAIASARNYLGFAAWLQADFALAEQEARPALAIFRALGDAEGIVWSLISLGTVARYRDAGDLAATLLRESLARAERIGFGEGIAWSVEQLGLLAFERGEPDAGRLLRESLALHRELRDRWRACSLVEDLAAVALAQGDAAAAVSLLAAAEHARQAIGTVVAPCEAPMHAATVAGARAALGDEAYASAWQQGIIGSIDDLLAGLAAQEKPVRAAAPPAPVPAAAPLRIRALGTGTVSLGDVEVTAASWGYAKPRELFFLLVSSPPLTKEQIGAALWPDLAPRQLGNALHTGLRGLRRALGDPGWVVYSGGKYAFNADLESDCDLIAFERALAKASQAKPAAAALPLLERAIGVYGGDFLAGVAAGDWVLARREELRRRYESALLAASRLQAGAGRLRPAVTMLRRAVAHEPLNETAHRELMSCLARQGETARAISHYHELAEMLDEQLGVPPAAQTTALYRKLVGGRTSRANQAR
jgi:predicted ATPase/DNA-binding SARP family transcriptional activator